MVSKKLRIRCPVCGMLVWQERLGRWYELEFISQEFHGGKGHTGAMRYKRLVGKMAEPWKQALAEKIRAVANLLDPEYHPTVEIASPGISFQPRVGVEPDLVIRPEVVMRG